MSRGHFSFLFVSSYLGTLQIALLVPPKASGRGFQLVPPSTVADDPVFLAGQEKFRLSLLKNLARAIKEVRGRVHASLCVVRMAQS